MANKKKSTQQPPVTQMANSTDIKIIFGIKPKHLSGKINEYGTNHMFQVLGETPLKELIELEDMKMQIWEDNSKYYLNINAVKLQEVQVENAFKNHPYIMGLSSSKYDFQKGGEQITGCSIFEINKNIKLLYIEMGLSESSLNIITKQFSFLMHC